MIEGEFHPGEHPDQAEIHGMPEHARCLGCGYMLRGLPEPVCPECGRSFDPADPTTYDPNPPGSRRRRWVRRGIVAGVIVLLLLGFFPRRLLSGSITFTDIESGDQVVVRRWEPVPPSWIPFRYPGVHWTSGDSENIREAGSTASRRSWDVQVRSDNWIGSCCMGTTRDPGEIVEVIDLETTPSTAPDVLKGLTSPSGGWTSIRSRMPP
jgi:rRNA maturation protein Nop10